MNTLHNLNLHLARLDGRYVKLLLLAISLALFVLGAGAPETGGGSGG